MASDPNSKQTNRATLTIGLAFDSLVYNDLRTANA